MDNTINAPKIPSLRLKFSFPIHKFQAWKPDQKDLNYRYAGFQILDWNSNFQSSPVWTNEKLQRIFFSYKDLFTIKFPLIKIYCLRWAVYQKTDSNCPLVIFCFPFFFPPSLRYNITHSSNFNFYLGTTHFLKKIISNFVLLERPLSSKQIFHYYT